MIPSKGATAIAFTENAVSTYFPNTGIDSTILYLKHSVKIYVQFTVPDL